GDRAQEAQRRRLGRGLAGPSPLAASLHAAGPERAQPALDGRLPGEPPAQRPEGDEGGDCHHDRKALVGIAQVHCRPQTLMVAMRFMMKMPKPMLQPAAAATICPVSVENSGPM